MDTCLTKRDGEVGTGGRGGQQNLSLFSGEQHCALHELYCSACVIRRFLLYCWGLGRCAKAFFFCGCFQQSNTKKGKRLFCCSLIKNVGLVRQSTERSCDSHKKYTIHQYFHLSSKFVSVVRMPASCFLFIFSQGPLSGWLAALFPRFFPEEREERRHLHTQG